MTETLKAKWALRIERMKDGGYVVLDQMRSPMSSNEDERYMMFGPLYAATTIDECLAYIKRQLERID